MADLSSSIVAASVLVGMLTVPAASQTVDGTEPVSGDLPNVSAADSGAVPSDVETTSSPGSFTRTVETAFEEFELSVESDSSTLTVESPSSSLEIERKPGETTWKLETASGALEVTKSPSGVSELTETPYGTLEVSRSNGKESVSFEGTRREKVEQIASELRSELEDRKHSVEERRSEAVSSRLTDSQIESSLSISIEEESPEYVAISNSLSVPVDFEGWTLEDEAGSEHEFGDVEIPENGALYAYSGEKPDGLEEDSDDTYVYDTDIAWNNDEDVATLLKDGEVVVEKSYSGR